MILPGPLHFRALDLVHAVDVPATARPGSSARFPASCMEKEEAKEPPFPAVDQATRTEFGPPRSSIRLRAAAAMATSVARAWSLWKRSPSPMTLYVGSS